MNWLVIGAGISGLMVAQGLQAAGHKVSVVEKSRGLGGRLATRRVGARTFDHGLQFYEPSSELEALHQRWGSAGVSAPWLELGPSRLWRGEPGMTALAKNLGQGLEVILSERVEKLQSLGGKIQAVFSSKQTRDVDRVILTAPVPQALELLEASNWEFPAELRAVVYDPALIGLYSLEKAPPADFDPSVNLVRAGDVVSIVDVQKKGISAEPGWVVRMSPDFSRTHFDQSETVVLERIDSALQKIFPEMNFSGERELKKWRYSQPQNPLSLDFARIGPQSKHFLIGDAFSGGNFEGAVRSGKAVLRSLS